MPIDLKEELNNSLRKLYRIDSFYELMDIIQKNDIKSTLYTHNTIEDETKKILQMTGNSTPGKTATVQTVIASASITIEKFTIAEFTELLMLQSIESAFSILESFMSVCYEAMLHSNNELLKSDKQIPIVEIVDNSEYIIDYLISREIRNFSHLCIVEKRNHLQKILKPDTGLWNRAWRIAQIDELKKLDKLRQEIVHGRNMPSISCATFGTYMKYIEEIAIYLALVSEDYTPKSHI